MPANVVTGLGQPAEANIHEAGEAEPPNVLLLWIALRSPLGFERADVQPLQQRK